MKLDKALEYVDEAVDLYEFTHDCNFAENDMWDNVIDIVLQKHSDYFSHR